MDAVTSALRSAPSIASPWSTGQLATIVWGDLFGVEAMPVTRAEAMAVPALARARHLLTTTIARLPLHAYRDAELVDPQPTWTYRTDGPVSPFHRMLWTVDDLIFTGWSLWAVDRDADGHVITADRVPADVWELDATSAPAVVTVNGREVTADSAVLIPGPHEGVLCFGGRTIRSATSQENAYAIAARTPVPAIELHQTTDVALDDATIAGLVEAWAAARRGESGGVAYTNSAVEVREHGSAPEQLLIEGRNAAAVDIARDVGIPAAMVDATTAGASLTYETTAGRNQEFLDYGLAGYMTAVSARLSQDDVLPRGQRVAFDLEDLIGPAASPTGPALAD
jgi:hypothetical protein